MLKPGLSDEDLELQGERYGGHQFRTYRQVPILIDDSMSLRQAFDNLKQAKREWDATIAHQSMVSGKEAYAAAQQQSAASEDYLQDCRAQAMAALYRETGTWPHEFYSLGLR